MKSTIAADNELFWLLVIVLVGLAMASIQQALGPPQEPRLYFSPTLHHFMDNKNQTVAV